MKTAAPPSTLHAICWASGKIQFVRNPQSPRYEGAIRLASGPSRRLRNVVTALARLAYDKKTLLVPGVPEADSSGEAVTAAIRFRNELKGRI